MKIPAALTLVFAVLLLAMPAPGVASGDSFADGVRAFEDGRHLEARGIFSELLERGETSANTFYNLGNANAHIGALGLAALNFEQALVLDAQHSEARENLARIRARTGAVLPEGSKLDAILRGPGFDGWVLAMAAAVWSGLFAILIPFVRRVPMRGGNWVAAAFAAVIAAVSVVGLWHARGELNAAIVLSQEVDARQLPSEQAPLLPQGARLTAGSRVIVLAERGEWVHCRMPNGGVGWLPAPAIGKIRETKWDFRHQSSEPSS
jgi:tetratricopeptide (TPR) repeat protein